MWLSKPSMHLLRYKNRGFQHTQPEIKIFLLCCSNRTIVRRIYFLSQAPKSFLDTYKGEHERKSRKTVAGMTCLGRESVG